VPRALIVGGTGSIGRATARRLLAAGWHVDLTGRNPARLPADIAAAGGRFVAAAPRFGGPIRETQPTVAPGDGDYATREGYGANKVAAEQVLLDRGRANGSS
jgi:nucleoside-diphosphate-sugar epimerase